MRCLRVEEHFVNSLSFIISCSLLLSLLFEPFSLIEGIVQLEKKSDLHISAVATIAPRCKHCKSPW